MGRRRKGKREYGDGGFEERERRRAVQALRRMPHVWFRELPDADEDSFGAFVREHVLPLLTTLPAKYKLDQQERLAVQVAYRLFRAAFEDKCVADPRRHTQPGVRMRVGVWDAYDRAGLVFHYKGTEAARKCSRYAATAKLLKTVPESGLTLPGSARTPTHPSPRVSRARTT